MSTLDHRAKFEAELTPEVKRAVCTLVMTSNFDWSVDNHLVQIFNLKAGGSQFVEALRCLIRPPRKDIKKGIQLIVALDLVCHFTIQVSNFSMQYNFCICIQTFDKIPRTRRHEFENEDCAREQTDL